MKIFLILFALYVLIGVIKLKYFDRNGEADWLIMLTDKRNRKCGGIWIFLLLPILWLSWPIAIFTRNFNLAGIFFRFQWRYM
ncbi:MAG: hypothetical protein WCW14_00150 [Candidatus Paceibacterota bacterium]